MLSRIPRRADGGNGVLAEAGGDDPGLADARDGSNRHGDRGVDLCLRRGNGDRGQKVVNDFLHRHQARSG